MSVKKVEEMRRDRGRGGGKKEEKRPGAMRAPLRPRFQRPRTQLVHLLLDVQPLARVLLVAVLILSVCLSDVPCIPREVLNVGRFSERTNAISNESKVFWNFGRRSKSTGSSFRHLSLIIDEIRDCTLLMGETRTLEM